MPTDYTVGQCLEGVFNYYKVDKQISSDSKSAEIKIKAENVNQIITLLSTKHTISHNEKAFMYD